MVDMTFMRNQQQGCSLQCTRPVSGPGSDIYEWLVDAVPVGTASLTRQL